MPFVIAEPCIDYQDQACVRVCPVACIHFEQDKDRKLYIDPDECIDLALVSQCARLRRFLPSSTCPRSGASMQRLTSSGFAIKRLHGPWSMLLPCRRANVPGQCGERRRALWLV